MKVPLLILIFLIFLGQLSIMAQPFENRVINILEKGAVGDGLFANTEIIQQAIDQLNAADGGTVVIPEGHYLTGPLQLKSGVRLHIEFGAVLLGSTDPLDYLVGNTTRPLIHASNADNISITGRGTIDGRGLELYLKMDSLTYAGEWPIPRSTARRALPGGRPRLVLMQYSNDIYVEGITLRNSGSWVIHFERCTNVVVDNITSDSDNLPNNDGIAIDNSRNFRLTNSYINSQDDGIVLKSRDKDYYIDNVYIANCIVRASAAAIKYGTESRGGIKNVKIENIRIYDNWREAISLLSVDGGFLENIEISNVTAINTGGGIFIRLGNRDRSGTGKVGTLKNVSIKNVFIQVPYELADLDYRMRGPDLPFFMNHLNPLPSGISGIPGHYVENIHLENIRIYYPGKAYEGYAYRSPYLLDEIPESESSYPQFHMFGEMPAWGFFVRHVKGLTMKDIDFRVRDHDFRPAFVLHNVADLEMERVRIFPSHDSDQIYLKNVTNKRIHNISVEGRAGDGIKNLDTE